MLSNKFLRHGYTPLKFVIKLQVQLERINIASNEHIISKNKTECSIYIYIDTSVLLLSLSFFIP